MSYHQVSTASFIVAALAFWGVSTVLKLTRPKLERSTRLLITFVAVAAGYWLISLL